MKLEIGTVLPGETLVSSILEYLNTRWATMDPQIRTEWDKIILEDYKEWREWWRALIKEKK